MTPLSKPQRPKRLVTWLVSVLLIVVVIAGSAVAFQQMAARKPKVQARDLTVAPTNIDAFVVQRVTAKEIVAGFGTAEADREVIVAAQVSGEITRLNENLRVGRTMQITQTRPSANGPSETVDGDVMVEIDPRSFQQQVSQAQNSYAEAESELQRLKVQKSNTDRQLKQAQAVLKTLTEEYERAAEGQRRKTLSASQLNQALLEQQRYQDVVIQLENQVAAIPLQISAAQQRLSSSQVAEQRAQDDLEKTKVLPPFDGVLSDVMVEQGQFIRTGEPLVRLTDLNVVEVPISLGFDDYLQVQQLLADGSNPIARLAESDVADPRWEGRVVRAAPVADSGSRTVNVFVRVNNTPDRAPLLPGTFAMVRIDATVHKDILLVPRESVSDGTLFVVEEETVRRIAVKTGRRFQSLVEIVDGLDAEQSIAITNLDRLKDGTRVVVQNQRNVAQEIAGLRKPLIEIVDQESL